MMQSIFGMPEALDIGPHKFTGMIRTGPMSRFSTS